MTSADKSNSVVLLDKDKYVTKVHDFIRKGNATIIKDPTSLIDRQVRKYLNNAGTEIIKEPKKLINKNPHAPRLYGTIKIHKANDVLPIEEVPIRPVVSSYTSPIYLLEKELVRLFHLHIKWKSTRSIKNRSSLIQSIHDTVCPPDTLLISLDVNSLFTKVDIPIALAKLLELVRDHSDWSLAEIQAYSQALVLCTEYNYFQFDGKTYQQKEGCSMGSPLSPLLAEVYMEDFEDELFNLNSPLFQHILVYKRYVDDILLLFTAPDQIDPLFNLVNSIRENLKFDIEIGGNTLNFLDLTIKLCNNKLEFSIYHKPSSTDICIPNDSVHPQNHKMSAFRAYMFRLLEVPMSPEDFQSELNIIYQLALSNGYDKGTIDKLYFRTLNKYIDNKFLYHSYIDKPTDKQFRSLQFVGKASYKIAKTIEREEKVKIAFYNKNKLKNIIFNMKDHIPLLQKSGIYNITVPGIGEYIGKTSRAINTRIKEHFASVRNNHQEKSGFAKFMIENSIPTSLCQIKPLNTNCGNDFKLGLYETLYIKNAIQHGKNLFNNQIERNELYEIITP